MLTSYDMLCMNCMSPLTEGGKCKNCMYEKIMPENSDYLEAGTIIAERYLIGNVQHTNCEGILYIGLDTETDTKILVKEHFPREYATRNISDKSINPKNDYIVKFKSHKSDFEELCYAIKELSTDNNIVPLLDAVLENNTIYAVYKYIPSITFSKHLAANYGELNWTDAKKMFMPFCTMLSNFHKKGLIHRGISPDTVFVDENDNLLLFGFAIPATRTKGDREPEIFSGYAAPEQYLENGWQGEWTDVYAVAALLYRALTGAKPADANIRSKNDDLVSVTDLNNCVPQNVSDAIANGMLLNYAHRISKIDEFTSQLLESTDGNTAVFSTDKMPIPEADTKTKEEKPTKEKPIYTTSRSRSSLYIILVALFTGGVFFSILWGVVTIYHPELIGKAPPQSSTSSSEVSSSSSEPEPEPVPSFTGKYIDAVYEDPNYNSKYAFKVTEEYNDQYPAGIIISQIATPPGNGQADVTVVNLTVSKGSKAVPMPNLAGSRIEYATKTLEDLNIYYEIFEIVDPNLSPGVVSKTSVQAGDIISREKDKVFLYVKKIVEPPPPSAESSSSTSSSSDPYYPDTSDND